jgi:hypothetical protein
MGPGATVLQVMFSRPTSLAIHRVRLITPALAAA